MAQSTALSARIARTPASNGQARAQGTRVVILATRFHPAISQALVRGALDILRRQGIDPRAVTVCWVPGAFELPVVAARLARAKGRPDAIIAVGALIRGQTPQYDIIAHAVAQGLMQVAVMRRLPVTFGVIVATTVAQAKARAGGRLGNRGAEAALAALEVLQLP